MKGFVLGVVVTILVVATVVYVYFATGMAPVATSAAPMKPIWLRARTSTWSSVMSAMASREKSRPRSLKANSLAHRTFSKVKA